MKRIKIPLISIDKQAKISSIITAYDELIENNTKRIQLLEKSAHLLYKEWFINLRFPGHEHVKIIDGVPEGWEKCKLGEISFITMGQSPKSIYYNQDKQGLPFHQGVTNFGNRFPSHETYCTKENRIATPGDILFSVRAPVGRINITLDKIIIGRGLASIRSNIDQQNFLFYALKNYFFKENMIGGGAIFASITKKDLHEVTLIQPTSKLVKFFSDYILPIDQQIATLSNTNDKLTKARDLLLPRLMNGEIKI
jgi:type I restriction enzyme S subunit